MIDVIKTYIDLCKDYDVPFDGYYKSVLSYNDSTLFCPAGMQRYKHRFGDPDYFSVTTANIQRCLRNNDIDEISDGFHALAFDMIGLFSFQSWSVPQTINFFLDYLNRLGVVLSYVTIHPDKTDWYKYYPDNILVKLSYDCIWSDGEIGGFCTEFFVTKDGIDIEIGNIVNPLGHSIDVGFGKERLEYILGVTPKSANEQLEYAALSLIEAGIKPSANKHGYVLRSILRRLIRKDGKMNHQLFLEEEEKHKKALEKYYKLLDKFPNMSYHWWWDTHGINPEFLK